MQKDNWAGFLVSMYGSSVVLLTCPECGDLVMQEKKEKHIKWHAANMHVLKTADEHFNTLREAHNNLIEKLKGYFNA